MRLVIPSPHFSSLFPPFWMGKDIFFQREGGKPLESTVTNVKPIPLDNNPSLSLSHADVPQSVLSLGPNLNGSNIKEGDDVYFECSVRANPRPYKITWRFNVSFCSSRRRRRRDGPIPDEKTTTLLENAQSF